MGCILAIIALAVPRVLMVIPVLDDELRGAGTEGCRQENGTAMNCFPRAHSKTSLVAPTTQRYYGRSGMTLVEVMIAVAIMGIVLGSVLAIISQSANYVADMRLTARSTQVLHQRIEDIRLYTNWPSVLALNNSLFTNTTVDISGQITNRWIGAVTIGSFSPYSISNVVSATVSVTWKNRTGTSVRTNSLSTLISNGGLDTYIF